MKIFQTIYKGLINATKGHTTIIINGKRLDPNSSEAKEVLTEIKKDMEEIETDFKDMFKDLMNIFK